LQPFINYNFKHGYVKSREAARDADMMSVSLVPFPKRFQTSKTWSRDLKPTQK